MMFYIFGALAFLVRLNSISCGWFGDLRDVTTCLVGFCCNPTYIPADVAGLKRDLQQKLYGQHLVIDTVVHAVRDHWESGHAQKALTLSFHGSPGTGKNYVANMIKKNLYKNMDYVHHFNGRIHFPLTKEVETYQRNLHSWVRGNTSRCGRQMFIFDEVDKMPPAVLNVIKPMIDYNMKIDGVDYRETIFVFLSNTGAKRVTEEYLKLWNQGVKREDLKLSHFEKLILEGAFNEAGGFQYSDNIRSNLIDHYIPFLPMEQSHVRLCIQDEFRKRGVHEVPEQVLEELLDVVDWGPPSHKLFAKTGCKRLSQKVGVYASQYRTQSGYKNEL